jgi:hypothetical protein
MGGLGDLVILSSSLLALSERTPWRPLVLATLPKHVPVLQGLPFLKKVITIPEAEMERWFKVYDLRWTVEPPTIGTGKLPLETYISKDRSDIFDALLGVQSRKEFSVAVNPAAKIKLLEILPQKPPLIALNATCASATRCFPPEYIEPLARLLRDFGTPVLCGKTESWSRHLAKISIQGIVNLIDRLTVLEFIALLSFADFVITADTSSYHIAAALKKKTLVVFGNIEPHTRTTYYPTVTAISPEPAEVNCFPCWDQPQLCKRPATEFGGKCMRVFPPQRIFEAFCSISAYKMRGNVQREVHRVIEPTWPPVHPAKRIAFVHDCSIDYHGGAELCVKTIVELGRRRRHIIKVFGQDDDLTLLKNFDLIILSNIWRFPLPDMEIILLALEKVPHIKWEHDHRSLDPMAENKYPRELFAKQIFKHSKLNIFGSPAHRQNYRDELGTDGVCIFPPFDVDLFRSNGQNRIPGSVLVPSAKKNGEQLKKYMEEHPHLTFNLLEDNPIPPGKMPDLYAQNEIVVHLPEQRWSCERVIFEAALCGCQVVTNDNAQGVSWGLDLSDPESLRDRLRNTPQVFWQFIEGAL